MRHRRAVVALCIVAAVSAAAAVVRARDVLAPGAPPPMAISPGPALPREFPADTLEEAQDLLIGTDPFRLANAPSAVPFVPGAAAAGTMAPPPTRPPRPQLTLKAVMGGPPWQAVVDGLSGQGGTVVRAGETVADLVISRITADTVVVRGPDTTWTLTLRRNTP